MADHDAFHKLAESWGSPFVARNKVDTFSGGVLNSKTMANKDGLGEGPAGRKKFGQKVYYETESLCDWLRENSIELN